MIFKSSKTYDVLKYIALIVLPLSALVSSIGEIWNIPILKYVSLTLIAIDTFLGAIIDHSAKKWQEVNAEVLDPKKEGVD
jgi:uncharacterized membrane protein